MNELERGYRRLLALYPRDHRERHEEEMLGVLLDGAGEQTRPGPRETVDVLWGAARLHLRRIVGADGGIRRRDVLAVVSLLGPFAMLIGASGWLLLEQPWHAGSLTSLMERAVSAGQTLSQWRVPDLPVWAAWFVVAVLALFRLRRTAAVGAWLGTIGFFGVSVIDPNASPMWLVSYAGSIVSGLAVAAALTWSPGPARGWELVGGRRITLFAGVVVATVLLWRRALESTWLGELALIWVGVVVFAAGALVAGGVRSRTGRRAALVLVLPIVLSAVLQLVILLQLSIGVLAAVCYGVLVIALLAAVGPAGRRSFGVSRS